MSGLPAVDNSPLELRGRGRLTERFPESAPRADDPPRALKALAKIVDGGLCHRCGSCVGICPTAALGIDDEEYPIVRDLSACTDCDLCVKVCPGDDFDAPEYSRRMFGGVAEVEDVYGQFRGGYLTHTPDPKLREATTSGGFVTALLLALLESGTIDGAVVVEADRETPFKGVPRIARTREEILAAKKSKYAIVSTNRVFADVLDQPGRYAFVGLPCQIHGLHKAAALDKRLGERIVLTVALICHAAIEHDPLKIMYERLGPLRKDVTGFLYRKEKHPGSSYVTMRDGSYKPVMFPNKSGYQPTAIEMMNLLYRLYTPLRCMTCYDSMGEFADIAAGDPWMPKPVDNIDFYEGYTFAMVRTERGERAFDVAVNRKALSVIPLDAKATRTSNLAMGMEKRYRAFRLIESRRAQGLPVPDYGLPIPAAGWKHRLLTEVNLLTHMFCFLPHIRDGVLRFALSEFGYKLFWLNNKRRRLRTWRRDLVAKLSRRRKRAAANDEHW